jgi:peptide chain release factor subunit 1
MSRQNSNPTGFDNLFSRPERPNPSVLSVYLNVDQSRQSNRNRGFENQLKDLMFSIRSAIHDEAEREAFAKASHHVSDFVSAYEPHARGLAIFFDVTDDFFWHKDFSIPLHNRTDWSRELLLQPLANAIDQFEPYGIVLLDRNNLRLFSVFLGEITEIVHKQLGSGRVRHIKTAGTDHLGSASHVQKKADEQIRANLRSVVKTVDELLKDKRIRRLVLGGTPEMTAELRSLLPKHLALQVIGSFNIRMEAAPQDILAAAQKIADEHERTTEVQTVKEVVTAAAKNENAVIGLGQTLKALNADRVWELVYSDDFSSQGFECVRCGALFSVEKTSCAYCSAPVQAVKDIVERAVEHTLRNGARIEVVTGEASAALDASGGIGAFLRTRTASIQL